MPKIAGVTVVYNPEISIIENIHSYLKQVDLLYVINNSEEELNPLIKSFCSTVQIKFIDNSENLGIAYALNLAANLAIKDGYDFLLTMDQDSKVSDNLVDTMLKEFSKDETIGILSPYIIHPLNPKAPTSSDHFEITVAMTSGSILRLSIFKVIGEFIEKFFIDYVDHEYCLRMISRGFRVLQLNSVYIYHSLGKIEPRKILFKKVFPTNHSPVRWYYRTRNRFYVYKKYRSGFPDYVKNEKKIFLKELLKIIFYENKKLKKISMIIKGYMDYKKDIYGKFQNSKL